MRSFLLTLTCIFLFPLVLKAQPTNLFDKLLYTSHNDTLPYRLLKPVNPGAKKVFPLIIFLHGAGERGNDNEVQIKHISNLVLDPDYRGKYPCYVVAPQCPKNEWWANYKGKPTITKEPTQTMQLVIELIDKIMKEYPIDASRVYITGLSMGGYGTWDLIARYPDKFAAAIPICGGGDEQTAPKIKHIPLWAFHGAKDNTVAPRESRTMIKALQNAGGSPGYTEYPDVGHFSWVQAYQEPHLLPWLFKQSLKSDNSN